jgi:imidazolonepropionase-like amidohydrolase
MFKQLLAGAAALAIAGSANAATYAIQAGRLIVDAAQPGRGASTVIVDNGRISRIDSGFTAPAGAIVVDERSKTVMPGMTDVHVHLTQNSGEPWYVGFTQKYSNEYATTLGLTHALEMARAGFSGAQFFALGIIGEYLARMHSRMMERPAYAIAESIAFEAAE